MAAGERLTQHRVNIEVAALIKELNLLGFKLRKIQETLTRLGKQGMLDLDAVGEAAWTEQDADDLLLAVNALVIYFDGFSEGDNAAIKAKLDSLAAFGY